MEFRIANTFTASLARLTNAEQKATKTKAFDLQMDPTGQGLNVHRLTGIREKDFWTVYVNDDLRLIYHQADAAVLLCYVAHHKPAYEWAERRRIVEHPKTGAAQRVEIRERVQEVVVPAYVPASAASPLAATKVKTPAAPAVRPPLFAAVSDDDLLGYGVPPEWLPDVRGATDDTLLDLAGHLPQEAAEALLAVATGHKPEVPAAMPAGASGFDHPAAQQRFRLIADAGELQAALDAPWDAWAVFLHPDQRALVDRRFNGPARVAGSAGTGKTVVALHRAVALARRAGGGRVLVTTFSDPLARMLRAKLDRLLVTEPAARERLTVTAIDALGRQLYADATGAPPSMASEGAVRQALGRAAATVAGHAFTERFLLREWETVVDAWGVTTWEAYRSVSRPGRRTRLGEKQRDQLWQILDRASRDLAGQGLVTMSDVFGRLATSGPASSFAHVVVDEAQDISVAQLRFLARVAGGRPDGLFFAGDLGQRIFQAPFSWKSLGVDVRGRSFTLRVNYRTSHQIRRHADRLLPPTVADVDGESDDRNRTTSAFSGPDPTVALAADTAAETATVAQWLKARVAEDGMRPGEMGVFVRSEAELPRGMSAVRAAGMTVAGDGSDAAPDDGVLVGTMHDAKGLEFRAVVVMACDDEVVPLQARVESVADEPELEEIYTSERHLLYVACTRARDHLLVTAVKPGSEFLDDLRVARPGGRC